MTAPTFLDYVKICMAPVANASLPSILATGHLEYKLGTTKNDKCLINTYLITDTLMISTYGGSISTLNGEYRLTNVEQDMDDKTINEDIVNIFHSKCEEGRTKSGKYINRKDIHLPMLYEIYKANHNTSEKATNENWKHILSVLLPPMMEKFEDHFLANFAISVARSSRVELPTMTLPLQLGAKMTPMTYEEVFETHDIRLPLWREAYAERLCGILVMNMVSPSFPITASRIFVPDTNASNYDSADVWKRYEISKKTEALLHANDGTIHLAKLNPSKHNKEVSKRLKRADEYAHKYLLLTDVSLYSLRFHIGRLLDDLPVLMKKDWRYEMLTRPLIFERLMFDYVWALAAMNEHLGLIHGKFLATSATMFDIVRGDVICPRYRDLEVEEREIAFNISGGAYMMPHIGFFGCITDFADVIFNITPKLIEHFGEMKALEVHTMQSKRILFAIKYVAPHLLEKYADAIDKLISSHSRLLFKAITGYDMLVLCKDLIDILTPVNAPDHMIALCQKFAKLMTEAITSNLQGILDGSLTKCSDFEWGNRIIMQRHYSDRRVWGAVENIEHFDFEAPLDYDYEMPSRWHPALKLSQEELQKAIAPLAPALFGAFNIDRATKIKPPIDEDWQKATLTSQRGIQEYVLGTHGIFVPPLPDRFAKKSTPAETSTTHTTK